MSLAASLVAFATLGSLSPTPPNLISVADIVSQRKVGALEASRTGERYAVLVYYADPVADDYVADWYVGSRRSGELIHVARGGRLPRRDRERGAWLGQRVQWSPDGRWIAYTRDDGSETQLWRARADGSLEQQLSHNAADVGFFGWSGDGQSVFFRTGETRADQADLNAVKKRRGYRFDHDISAFTDLFEPAERPSAGHSRLWKIDIASGKESLVGETSPGTSLPETPAQEMDAFEKRFELGLALQGTNELLERCTELPDDAWLCVRSTQDRPAHIVEVRGKKRRSRMLADLNPAFTRLRFGKVERIEWDVPDHPAYRKGEVLHGLIKPKAHGFILYPPNFDPKKRYPMIVSPYYADGFDDFTRSEMPLQAYAAAGFVVLNLSFPTFEMPALQLLGRNTMRALYDPSLGFPHLTLFADSTLAAIDLVLARGFTDRQRVGIGGLSQGTFIPLWAVQHHDRFSAMSISSPSWGPWQYYWQTNAPPDPARGQSYMPRPEHKSEQFWKALDIAENVDEIETPILMNFGDTEVWAMLRLIRHMAEGGKPYDAYVYKGEGHIKVDPAHLESAMNRNLDWFRFWLQDMEDPDPAKAKQYEHWRGLRQLQCKNPRSLRDYCNIKSSATPIPTRKRGSR